jgi:hypothetical protein
MLNPIEYIWSKVKCYTKTHRRVPQVVAPGVIEQRLVYLEEIIDAAKDTITGEIVLVQRSTPPYIMLSL